MRSRWTATLRQRSAIGGQPENICSLRGLPPMTQSGSSPRRRFRVGRSVRSYVVTAQINCSIVIGKGRTATPRRLPHPLAIAPRCR
jgi:hypothetical protein